VARPKAYDRDAALQAARDLFWERGYERTSIGDLEARTGLNRSSLYGEFGSKRELFDAALECYADRVIVGLLAGLGEAGTPGLAAIAGLFQQLAGLFRCDTILSARGCLMVNTIAEMAADDPRVRAHAAAYRDRLRAGFGAALARAAAHGETDTGPEEAQAHTRADLLTTSLMGIWLAVRIDPADAAAMCETIAREVESWHVGA
jgi:TetR/AcrR family transcriptional regulator, transcriptional repressor for nem operon